MNIIQIQCFCAIVKYGSYSRAAESLFMSQSSVSKQMAALEKDCGFPLIIKKRKNGQIDLSVEGQLMLRDCNKLLSNYNQLLHLRDEMRKKPIISSMSFSLVGVPELAHYGVVSSISKFETSYSGASVHLVEADEFPARLSLLNEESDLAFISDIALDRLQYSWQNYCEETLSLVVSGRSPLAWKERVYMKDLAGYTLIAQPKKTNLFDFCLGACQSLGGFEPKFEFLTSRLSAALDYIDQHPHVIFLSSRHSLEPLRSENGATPYKVVDIVNSPSFHYVMAWRRGKLLSDKIKQYLRLVAEPAHLDFIKGRPEAHRRLAE